MQKSFSRACAHTAPRVLPRVRSFSLSVFLASLALSSSSRAASWDFLPATAPHFQSYLEGIFLPSDSCLQATSFVADDPISTNAQKVKSAAALYGLRYDLTFNFNYSSLHPSSSQSASSFASSDNELWATWVLGKSSDDSQSVFLMLEADWGQGFNFNERRSSVQDSLGSLSIPQSALRGGNGVFLPHVSLGYSGWDGSFISMLGTLDLSNFFDQNEYSADWNGNLLNESFNYNPCLPLFWSNWGYLTAWQPRKDFYMLYATAGTNGEVNHNPFPFISSNYWMHITEAGFMVEDMAGFGAGTYRFQYTLVRNEGRYGGGASVNFQQQLGRNQVVGAFTRMGYMDEDAASLTGVKAAATGGLVLMAPFTSSGWGSKDNNDQVAFGALWERAAESEQPYTNRNEYGLELSAVIQLTPTFFVQPDIQYIFNPVHAQDCDGAFVFQLQTTFRF